MNKQVKDQLQEILDLKRFPGIDQDGLDQYFFYDENFKQCVDEYIADSYDDDTACAEIRDRDDQIENMKQKGVWAEYMNKYFNKYLELYQDQIFHNFDWFYDEMGEFSREYHTKNGNFSKMRERNTDEMDLYCLSRHDFY